MKYFSIYVISLLSLLNGCESNNEINSPLNLLLSNKNLKLTLSSKKMIVLNKTISSDEVTPINASEIDNYFDKLSTFSILQKIIIKNNSNLLVKPYGIVEKSKWDQENLYLQIENHALWKLFGERSNST